MAWYWWVVVAFFGVIYVLVGAVYVLFHVRAFKPNPKDKTYKDYYWMRFWFWPPFFVWDILAAIYFLVFKLPSLVVEVVTKKESEKM